jgi:hypothetical protein
MASSRRAIRSRWDPKRRGRRRRSLREPPVSLGGVICARCAVGARSLSRIQRQESSHQCRGFHQERSHGLAPAGSATFILVEKKVPKWLLPAEGFTPRNNRGEEAINSSAVETKREGLRQASRFQLNRPGRTLGSEPLDRMGIGRWLCMIISPITIMSQVSMRS